VTKVMLIVSIVGGIAVTLVTGWVQGFLLYTQEGFNVIQGPLLGASNYGLPIVWRSVIVYPGSPTNYNLIGFCGDLLIWIVAIWIITYVMSKK